MQASQEKTSSNKDSAETQLIIFVSGNEEFAIPIHEVREIIKVGAVTSIPETPIFIKGITNVRGEVVTVIDIKKRFSLHSPYNMEPKHIIVSKQEDNLFGLMVDEVIEVLRIQSNEIKPTPSVIENIHKKYIQGVISYENRLIILLNLKRILSKEELVQLKEHKDKVQDKKLKKKRNML